VEDLHSIVDVNETVPRIVTSQNFVNLSGGQETISLIFVCVWWHNIGIKFWRPSIFLCTRFAWASVATPVANRVSSVI